MKIKKPLKKPGHVAPLRTQVPMDPEAANQDAARKTDNLVTASLDVAFQASGNPSAVIGGAIFALVRFIAATQLKPPGAVTPKTVLDLMIDPITLAALSIAPPALEVVTQAPSEPEG